MRPVDAAVDESVRFEPAANVLLFTLPKLSVPVSLTADDNVTPAALLMVRLFTL